MIAAFDIDGVLADATHRQHLVESRPKDWEAFFAAVSADAPIVEGIALLQQYRATDDEVVLVSGRPESTRTDTEAWLARYGIEASRLILRPDGDYRPAATAKAELVRRLGDPSAFSMIVDDDERVTDTLARLGYPVRLFR